MESRSLIKFGSSNVISIPKEWLLKNNLKSGDQVDCKFDGSGYLVIQPKMKQEIKAANEILLNINGKKIDQIKREIVSSYLNDCETIRITGDNIKENRAAIKKQVQNLLAMEVIEESNNSIVTKIFFNNKDISIPEFIKKMGNIVNFMIDDLICCFDNGDSCDIIARDQDLNKISFAIRRTAKAGLTYPDFAKAIKATPLELFEYWTVSHALEIIADLIKEVQALFKSAKGETFKKPIKAIFLKIVGLYHDSIKSYYNKDLNLAYEVSSRREKINEEINNFDSATTTDFILVGMVLEKLSLMARAINFISRRVYS